MQTYLYTFINEYIDPKYLSEGIGTKGWDQWGKW